MKKVKRIMAAVLSAVMALSAVTICAGAKSIEETATAITSGKTYSTKLFYDSYYGGDNADYKITASQDGDLKIKLTSQMYDLYIYVFDSDGNTLVANEVSSTSGEAYEQSTRVATYWNDTFEKYAGTISYSIKKGTYYIQFCRGRSTGNGKIDFTATFPTSSSSTAKLSYISLELNKGSSIQLGGVFTSGSGTITWKSSKPSVAKVSSTGKVTAKAKGSTVISAKCGSKTVKIKIIVT